MNVKYAVFLWSVALAAFLSILEIGFATGLYHSGFKSGSSLILKILVVFWLAVWNPAYIGFLLYRANEAIKSKS